MIRTIKDIWYAVTSPEKYREFMNYKKRNLLLYVFVLVLLSQIITLGIPAAQFMAQGGMTTLLEENIPDFTISSEDGFWMEEPIEIDQYGVLVKADSSIVREDITDLNGKYGNYDYVIMIDQEQIYVKIAGMQDFKAKFKDLSGFSFDKEDLLAYVPAMYLAVAWAFIVSTIIEILYYFLTAFVVSWGAGVIASFMRLRLGNKRLFKMAVYAGTFSFILSLILNVLGKSIPDFTIFSLIISTGYMYFALKEYKESGIEELPPQKFDREG